FQHGRFNAHEVFEAAAALRFYAMGLCGYAALKVLVPAFYAIDRRKTPMFVSFGPVGLNLLLNWLFTVRLGWGHQGLAFSTACIATTNFIVLYLLMHRHLGRLESRAMLSLLLRLSVASAVLAGICWAGDHYLLAGWASERFLPKAGSLAAVIVVGAGAFLLCATALRIREMQDIVIAVQRRLRRAA